VWRACLCEEDWLDADQHAFAHARRQPIEVLTADGQLYDVPTCAPSRNAQRPRVECARSADRCALAARVGGRKRAQRRRSCGNGACSSHSLAAPSRRRPPRRPLPCDAIYSESRHDVEYGDAIYGESRHDVARGIYSESGTTRNTAMVSMASPGTTREISMASPGTTRNTAMLSTIYYLPATYLLRDCSLLRHGTSEIGRTTFQTEMDARPTAGSYRKAGSALGS
jgi:hypothetical protein